MPPTSFTVVLPSPFGKPGAALRFADASSQWRRLDPAFRDGDDVVIPADLFRPSARVPDEARHVVLPDRSLACTGTRIVPDGIVLVLESPHKSEFGPGLTAIRPLNARSTQRKLVRGLPALLAAAEQSSGIAVAGRQIVLVNAVQYQCSLQAFMAPGVRALQDRVRDRVWTALFEAGGASDLIRRIDACMPALVLLMPTKGVREALVNRIGSAPRSWPWMRVDRHPAGWFGAERLGDLETDDGRVAVAPAGGSPFLPYRFPARARRSA